MVSEALVFPTRARIRRRHMQKLDDIFIRVGGGCDFFVVMLSIGHSVAVLAVYGYSCLDTGNDSRNSWGCVLRLVSFHFSLFFFFPSL